MEERELITAQVNVSIEPSKLQRYYADFVLVQYKGQSVGLEFVDTGIISEEEKKEAAEKGIFMLNRAPVVRVVLPVPVAVGLFQALGSELDEVLKKLREQGQLK